MTVLFCTIAGRAQETNNFRIEGGRLVWQKVFEREAIPEDFFSSIYLSDQFVNIEAPTMNDFFIDLFGLEGKDYINDGW